MAKQASLMVGRDHFLNPPPSAVPDWIDYNYEEFGTRKFRISDMVRNLVLSLSSIATRNRITGF